jgi:hypothetical protein
MSSIALTRNVADKINELVDAYNELSKVNLDKIHEQDGTIRKAIIYLKDNLINTLHDLTEILENEGFFDKTVYKYVSTLESRVNNLISSIPDGGTTSDAELLDIRVNNEGTTYDNAGESVRAGYSALSNRMDNTSIYSLDLVKKFIGHKEIYSGDIEFFHGVASERWEYAHKTFNAPAGKYTIVVDDCNIPPAGYLKIAHTTTGVKFTDAITKPGIYQFTLHDEVNGFTERTILLQTSTEQLSEVGLYYARGIHIYEGWITDQQGLPDYFTGADKRLPKIYGKNLFNPATITPGYYLANSGWMQKEHPEYPGYYCSDYIEIKPGMSYAITTPYLGGGHICFYSDKNIAALKRADGSYYSWTGSTLNEANGIITAPSNAKYLRISGRLSDIYSTQVEEGSIATSFEPYTEYAPLTALELRVNKLESTSSNAEKKINTVDSVSKSSLTDGKLLAIESPNSKCGHSIGFAANFDSFNGELTISHGKVNPYCSAYMVLSADTIKIYSYESDPKLIASVDHGLTLSEYVFIDITTEYKKAHIRVTSSGADFELDTEWNGSNGNIIAEVSGMTLNNCTLSYFINDLDKDLWLFGDSYFDHWCEYANEYGYNGAMLDAYSGRGSLFASASLKKCLKKATPKKIAWFMGMNDADSSTAVNSNWLSVFNELKEICENNGIELILSTVPNVPGRNHEFKNEIVRNSGYRYIDVCHSVGADSSASWYDGLLSGDNVHASELGRMVMANYIIAMLPELKG